MPNMIPFRKKGRELGNEMWDAFNDFFNDDNFFAPFRTDVHRFRTDIKDTGNQYVVEAELPGFKKEDITVDYDQNYLTISAKRDTLDKEEKENYIRQERHFGEFVRRFFVEDIDDDKIEATFNNGLLTLTCPKRAIENANRKRIEIH